MSEWADKIVVVTGGSRGFGRVLAGRFSAAKATVVIVGRGRESMEKAVGELRSAGSEALGIQADVTQQADVDRLFARTLEQYGRIDVLVNNAGRSVRGGALETTPEQFRELMELNFIALVRCTRAAVPHLLKTRGHVVNIGSLAAKSAARWIGAYPATKHAVAAYSQQLRLELGSQGLHVLLVCPGPIARVEPRAEAFEGMENVPESARQSGAGVKVKAIDSHWLAAQILRACERRKAELVVPGKARLLFAIQQLWPSLGDWIVLRKT
jgi:short-subunit dehydrogenase